MGGMAPVRVTVGYLGSRLTAWVSLRDNGWVVRFAGMCSPIGLACGGMVVIGGGWGSLSDPSEVRRAAGLMILNCLGFVLGFLGYAAVPSPLW